MHTHSKEDEGFYLKKGELIFIIDGESIKLREGEYLNIEKGEEHTWRNESKANAELIITLVPAGIENMFKELDRSTGKFKDIGKKYGTKFYIDE